LTEAMFEQTAHAPGDQAPAGEHPPPAGARSVLYRIMLGILTLLVSINVWSGGPLFALWVGSRVQASIGTLSMAAVGATIGVLIVVTFVLYKALVWLNVRYYAATGRELPRHRQAWLKPMSGERHTIMMGRPPSTIERVVIVSVVVALELLVVWFFFFAHYSLVS
jgi:hypothetical protein